MTKYLHIIISLLLLLPCMGVAEEVNNMVEKNHLLHTVEVWGKQQKLTKENVGSRITTISQIALQSAATQSVGELLSTHSPIYIKSMGQGALATSSFRGTSSSHTAVNWNGITINPIMGGSFDFSQLPSFFIDEISLYHGSGYTAQGSGALGGAVILGNQPNWNLNNKATVRVLTEVGSNETYTVAGAVSYGNEKWVTKTKLYYQESENNFRYLNKVYSKDPFYERRSKAQYNTWSGMQELYNHFGEGITLSSHLWIQSYHNNLPQPIIIPDSPLDERQMTFFTRYASTLKIEKDKSLFSATIGYLFDNMGYWRTFVNNEGNSSSSNKTHTMNISAQYDYHITSALDLNAALSHRYNKVLSSQYNHAIERNITSLQGGVKWEIIPDFNFSTQIVGELTDGDLQPTFSSGLSYALLPEILLLKTSAAYNYHQPTLNDLYWVPGGNRDLRPEKGWAYDLSINFIKQWNGLRLRSEATYFCMDIADWIVWTPKNNSNLWSPINLKKVRSQGVELMADLSYERNDWTHRMLVNYSFTSAANREKAGTWDNSVGKQLPYIPRHKWNIHYYLTYKGLNLGYHISFVDKRYTSTDQSYRTNSYLLHNAEIGYHINKWHTTFAVKADNLFNTYYENTIYYPMPLRTIMGSISLFF